MRRIRTVIVDHDPEERSRLSTALAEFEQVDVETVGELETAIDLCDRHRLDVLITEVNATNTGDGLIDLRERCPDLKVLFMSGQPLEYIADSVRGKPIDGFYSKNAPARVLVTQIEKLFKAG